MLAILRRGANRATWQRSRPCRRPRGLPDCTYGGRPASPPGPWTIARAQAVQLIRAITTTVSPAASVAATAAHRVISPAHARRQRMRFGRLRRDVYCASLRPARRQPATLLREPPSAPPPRAHARHTCGLRRPAFGGGRPGGSRLRRYGRTSLPDRSRFRQCAAQLRPPSSRADDHAVILRGVRGQLLSHSRASSHTSNLVVHGNQARPGSQTGAVEAACSTEQAVHEPDRGASRFRPGVVVIPAGPW